jgi:glucose-1-phosphate thymidylyltransferase
MKALVLSGGSGTRLRPFSYSMPKQLMPIGNRPVLEHVLDNVRSVGAQEVGLVVGDHADEVRAVVGDGTRFGLHVTYLPQERPRGLAHAVQIAAGFLGGDDFVMLLGDNFLPDGIDQISRGFAARRPAAQIAVRKVPDPRAFGVAELQADGRVLRVAEKPLQPRSDLAIAGVYFFSPAVHEAVQAIVPSARGEIEITDAIQWLVERGDDVRADEYTGYWRDVGCVEDVLACNERLLEQMRPSVAGDIDRDSVLDGPVVVERGARIIRSRITGPVVIGADSVADRSVVGPGCSIGRRCTLRDATFEHSIALDGAQITAIGVSGSLIGRHAVVGLREPVTGRHRLVVGDHTMIEVAS